jgi:hypothetical protein
MVAFRVLTAVALVAAVVAAPGAASTALVEPGRTFSADAQVLVLGLTGRNVVVAVDETRTRCPRVELWLGSNARHRFRSTILGCKEGLSTGFGLTSVAVAATRALWITYVGGNTREWLLWTGSPTSAPRRLRLVRQDADSSEPPPLVLGAGTTRGVPFAVGNEIVYLGTNGKPIFRTTVASPVRMLAAGPGPGRLEVAAVLASGWVVGLDGAGQEYAAEPYPQATVKGLQVTASGTAVHSGAEVEILHPRTHEASTVELPAGATMLDVAQQRILYSLKGDLWAARIDTGERTRLVDGTLAKPALGQLSRYGLAWARDARIAWRSGTLP